MTLLDGLSERIDPRLTQTHRAKTDALRSLSAAHAGEALPARRLPQGLGGHHHQTVSDWWFVDAFAGEGCDNKGNPGSPLIAARVAEEINAREFPARLTKDTGMRVGAFEANHDRYACLIEVMAEFTAPRRPWPQTIAIVREGTLEAKLSAVLSSIGNAPALYFLDPFGIDGLSATVLPELLKGEHTEVLVLFTDEGALRLAGKALAGEKDQDAELAAAADSIPDSLFGEEATERDRADAVAAERRRLAGHKSNPRAEEILDRAFGGNWWKPIIAATPDHERREKLLEMYESVLINSGAKRCLRYAVRTPEDRHKYYLIHASKSVRAFTVMKDAMHKARSAARKAAAESPSLVELEDFNVENDMGAIADAIAQQFAGQREVRWTGASNSVQGFALEETALWRHEFDALQHELSRRGYTDLNGRGGPRRPMTFSFPS